MATREASRLTQLSSHVHRYEDICNVYVVVDDDRALLIDLGSGDVLDALSDIGVEHVDWILQTHHHRDQCKGNSRLQGGAASIGVPVREAHLFEDVEAFWQSKQTYDLLESTNVNNSLAASVRIDRRLRDYERLGWRGLEILVVPTPGHTKGSVTYVVEVDGVVYAFSGDLIHSPGRVWTLYDCDWAYGMSDGFKVAAHSVRKLRELAPHVLAPSHGDVMRSTDAALGELEANLVEFVEASDQGYRLTLEPDGLSLRARLEQVSEHLVAVTSTVAHFYALRDDDGHALLFDYGFGSIDHLAAGFRFVDHSLGELAEAFGIDRVEVVVPTHYHDDHVAGLAFLQERFGAEVWAYEGFADLLARPHAHRLPCLWPEAVRADRTIADGEAIEWRGFRFEALHNPGHTWYAAMFLGEVDGRRVGVTGDEILINPDGRLWGAGPVYRNRVSAGDYTRSIDKVIAFEPEILLTGHCGPLHVEREDLLGFRDWARRIDESWRALAALPEEIGFALDPNAVSVSPYQSAGLPGEPVALDVEIRNHHSHEAHVEVGLEVPAGWHAVPDRVYAELLSGATGIWRFEVTPPIDAPRLVRHVLLVDARIGERPAGEVAEALVTLEG